MRPSTFFVRAIRRVDFIVAVTFITVTLLVYGGALKMGYMADDFDWLRQALSSDYALFDRIATAGTGHYFRPLVTLSFRLEHYLGGTNAAFVHHVANLLIHSASAYLVYLATSFISWETKLPIVLSLFFLLHPLAVAPVFWLASRVDSLVTLFYLLAILGFLYLMEGRRPLLFLLMTLGSYAAALLSKEMAVTLPGVLFILWWLWVHSPVQRRARTPRSWLLLAWLGTAITTGAYFLFLWLQIYDSGMSGIPSFSIRGAGEALVSALLVLVVPNRNDYLVGVYYARPWLLPAALALLGTGAVLLAAFLQRRASRQLPRVSLLALSALFLITLVPLLWVGANSRRMHLPLAVLCLAIAFLVEALPRLRRSLLHLFSALLLPAAIVSFYDGSVWLENWHLTQQYCRSFRQHLAPGEERGFLLLTVPGNARNTHLFSNDANTTLYHCLHGDFHQFPRFLALGELRTQHAVPLGVTVSQPEAGHFVLSPVDEDDFFVLWPDAEVDVRYGDEQLSVYVNSLAAPGRVKQYTVIADQAALQDIIVLSFRGTEFYQLSSGVLE
jgi:hypothetical protein